MKRRSTTRRPAGEPLRRVIIQMPLTALWDAAGPVSARRSHHLSAADIRTLLQEGRVRFVVANLGVPPHWVPEADCFTFWKSEVRQRVADPEGRNYLSEFPGEYCYFASLWVSESGSPIVVLECAH